MKKTIAKYISIIFFTIALYHTGITCELTFYTATNELFTQNIHTLTSIVCFAISLVSFTIAYKNSFRKSSTINKIIFIRTTALATILWYELSFFCESIINFNIHLNNQQFFLTTNHNFVYVPITMIIVIIAATIVKHNLVQKEKMKQKHIDNP